MLGYEVRRRGKAVSGGAFLLGLSVVSLIGNSISGVVKGYVLPQHSFPATKHVQQGYAVPSELEIKVKDLDRDGRKEVVMEYGGRSYLLKLDKDGHPIAQTYDVRIVQK